MIVMHKQCIYRCYTVLLLRNKPKIFHFSAFVKHFTGSNICHVHSDAHIFTLTKAPTSASHSSSSKSSSSCAVRTSIWRSDSRFSRAKASSLGLSRTLRLLSLRFINSPVDKRTPTLSPRSSRPLVTTPSLPLC